MRGTVPGLATGVPLVTRMPAVYQEDPFTRRFLTAFDDVLAPVLATLDCLECYVDPRLAPADFLDWVAGWVGVDLDDTWPVGQRREVVAAAVHVHRRRGTADGLVDAVRLALGMAPRGADDDGAVTVADSGGAAWSPTAGGTLPGAPEPAVTVRVVTDPDREVDLHRLRATVAAVVPAHVPHEIVLVERPAAPGATTGPDRTDMTDVTGTDRTDAAAGTEVAGATDVPHGADGADVPDPSEGIAPGPPDGTPDAPGQDTDPDGGP